MVSKIMPTHMWCLRNHPWGDSTQAFIKIILLPQKPPPLWVHPLTPPVRGLPEFPLAEHKHQGLPACNCISPLSHLKKFFLDEMTEIDQMRWSIIVHMGIRCSDYMYLREAVFNTNTPLYFCIFVDFAPPPHFYFAYDIKDTCIQLKKKLHFSNGSF